MKKLDLANWNRKVHFDFFSRYEEPYFGLCAEVDCTLAYQNAKAQNASFFLYYLHKSVAAAIAIENFRYRIHEGEVFVYDRIDASATINREDGTFGFSHIPYHVEFSDFVIEANKEIQRVRSTKELLPAVAAENVIHYSSLPWIKFTSMSHARNLSRADSVPKISFGKITEQDGKKMMPVSIHVHHALVDGWHVAQYLERFQELLDEG